MSGLACVQSEILMRLISAGALKAAPALARPCLLAVGAYAVVDTLPCAACACLTITCTI